MLLRLSLIVAILAGLAALYFSHFTVQEKITTITTERDDAITARDTARAAETKARADARQAREELETTKAELASTSARLAETTQTLQIQQTRANSLSEQLTQVTGERNTAQQSLAAWSALGMSLDQVRTLRDQLAETIEARDAYVAENKILNRQLVQARHDLARLIGAGEQVVELPRGLRGQVVAVDPKFDFVVLDIGEEQGVLRDGQLLVSRNGVLVAKLRVTKVDANRSIANVVPGWSNGEVVEGDTVIPVL